MSSRKVAILGTVPTSSLIAPFDDPDWEIWACSAGNRGSVLRRVTRWFELHGTVDLRGQENVGWVPEYFGWLNAQTFPVYMQEPNDLCPRALVFPATSLVKEFGRLPFTSTIAWMIAFAIREGATEIGVFGVDMAATEEHYGGQKWGCLRILEVANERGITVTVPLESCLAQMPPLYGYADATRMGRRLIVQENTICKNIADIDATLARLAGERHMFLGALDQVRYFRRTFVDGADAELDEGSHVATIPSTAGVRQSLAEQSTHLATTIVGAGVTDALTVVHKGGNGSDALFAASDEQARREAQDQAVVHRPAEDGAA